MGEKVKQPTIMEFMAPELKTYFEYDYKTGGGKLSWKAGSVVLSFEETEKLFGRPEQEEKD